MPRDLRLAALSDTAFGGQRAPPRCTASSRWCRSRRPRVHPGPEDSRSRFKLLAQSPDGSGCRA